ncbi:MAG: D-alanine--D-alanine ligase [Alphaproteobacteria bacterium]|nr:D-alanine--D-alanine ligase [Alphaproteobacteria bacterium]
MNKKNKNILVIMGGLSNEREVSLVTGLACQKALEEAGYQVRSFDFKHNIKDFLSVLDPKPDVIFNALHGRFGEDGTIQALLNLLAIPYTHSGLLASSMAMNKDISRRIFHSIGLRIPEGKVYSRKELLHPKEIMPRPYVIKPINEGSSVGVKIFKQGDNKMPFDEGSLPDGDELLVERFIPGRELTVTILGNEALAVTELKPKRGFYDYEAKYSEGITEHQIPALIPKDVELLAKDWALKAHYALGCRGVTRSDLRYDDSKNSTDGLYILEINTQPGMTPLSLAPEQASYKGINFAQLVSWMVENAQCDN